MLTCVHGTRWYSGWCKRPCFHDEYLQAFNRLNVELVDTDGKGLDGITRNGIQAGDKEYEVDVIIWYVFQIICIP